MAAFGLIYGDFLKSVGDETVGTTLSNGMFNTVSSFTGKENYENHLINFVKKQRNIIGLLANGLLNTYSYRKVGFMGSILCLIGSIGLVFIQNLLQLIIFFGVIQGTHSVYLTVSFCSILEIF